MEGRKIGKEGEEEQWDGARSERLSNFLFYLERCKLLRDTGTTNFETEHLTENIYTQASPYFSFSFSCPFVLIRSILLFNI